MEPASLKSNQHLSSPAARRSPRALSSRPTHRVRSRSGSSSCSSSEIHLPQTSITVWPDRMGTTDRTPKPATPHPVRSAAPASLGKACSRETGTCTVRPSGSAYSIGARTPPAGRVYDAPCGRSSYCRASEALAGVRPRESGTRARSRASAAETRTPRRPGVPAGAPAGSTRGSGNSRAMEVVWKWPKQAAGLVGGRDQHRHRTLRPLRDHALRRRGQQAGGELDQQCHQQRPVALAPGGARRGEDGHLEHAAAGRAAQVQLDHGGRHRPPPRSPLLEEDDAAAARELRHELDDRLVGLHLAQDAVRLGPANLSAAERVGAPLAPLYRRQVHRQRVERRLLP
eukprot:scaffold13927_cov90-Isochrysis_galbana.AAC.1